MDTSSQLLLGALLLILSTALLLGTKRRDGRRRLPPGPPAVPLLGSLAFLTNSPANPEPLLRRLVPRYGPVVSLWLGRRLRVYIADPRLAHAALVESGAALADRPRNTAFELLGESDSNVTRARYGPTWRLLRRNLVSETLHPSRVRLFAPARAAVREALVEKLAKQAADAGEAAPPVVEEFNYAMFCLLVLMCFGERLDEPAVRAIGEAERAWLVYGFTKMSVFFVLPSITKHLFRARLQAGLAVRQRQKDLVMPLIRARREYNKKRIEQQQVKEEEKETTTTTFQHSYVDTLLDVRVPHEGGRALTDDEVFTLCSEFLNAGTDTTSGSLEWIMAELVKNPAIQDKLYAEIKSTCGHNYDQEEVSEEDTQRMPYLKAVVLESLRLHPPAHFVLPHEAAEDVEVGGYTIPKGTTVNFLVAEIGRDGREWDRPMEFRPERFLPGGDGEGVDVTGSREVRMMPFGVGRRICAGINIAMLHLEYFVANLVREFEWKEVPGHEVDLTETFVFTTVMKKPLRARVVPRRRVQQNK
ncbi:hypothetical protein PR202_ga07582 [Eleusine coracana subsp. coracana]|uniref:Uncharacterized protein n=1 Tax=Eleusine coracana subsp. coracana TaxID=191504 RepID=A0AAV5BYV0_ELECO|nr:hypothetical protein QOZ80_2AG0113740 [Eleusine coracana subsp. coracana]GJM91226.1 hypothetical protein PR202_ga07582 [Eleusine coracana subsp. coracana]